MNVADLPGKPLLASFRGPGLTWRVGPFVIRARTPIASIARGLAFLYGQFPLCEADSIYDLDLAVVRSAPLAGRVHILADGEPMYRWVRRDTAMPLIEWALNMNVFHRPHRYCLIHAAVVERKGRVAILPGPAGIGKSTLCAALIHQGWRLFSDEVALVRPSDGRILPVPRPVSLKEQAIELIRGFAPQATIGPRWPGTAKGTVAHMLPPPESVARAAEPGEPAWVVFPCYQPGAAARLTAATQASTLMRLADQGFNYSVLGRQGFETLAALVERCDCYDFVFDDLAEAVAMLQTMLLRRTEG